MKRLDSCLFVTFSEWFLDGLTGQPVKTTWGELVQDPSWYLWRRDRDTGEVHFVSMYKYFGHEQVARLEADLARFLSPDEIIRRTTEARTARLRQARETFAQVQQDKIAANKSRIVDLMNGKSGFRTVRSYSYSGQKNRSSSAEQQQVLKDAREDGWELPTEPE